MEEKSSLLWWLVTKSVVTSSLWTERERGQGEDHHQWYPSCYPWLPKVNPSAKLFGFKFLKRNSCRNPVPDWTLQFSVWFLEEVKTPVRSCTASRWLDRRTLACTSCLRWLLQNHGVKTEVFKKTNARDDFAHLPDKKICKIFYISSLARKSFIIQFKKRCAGFSSMAFMRVRRLLTRPQGSWKRDRWKRFR